MFQKDDLTAFYVVNSGMPEPGGGGAPPLNLADQLTLSQPRRTSYAHHNTPLPPNLFRPSYILEIQMSANFHGIND